MPITSEFKVIEFAGGAANGLFANLEGNPEYIEVPIKSDGHESISDRYLFNGKHNQDGIELWELAVVQ